jgi:hypothetical protein
LEFAVLISRSPQPSRKSLIALLESAINEIGREMRVENMLRKQIP